MTDRRTFLSLVAGAAVLPGYARGQSGAGKVALYASVGPVLTRYELDVAAATLAARESVTLPASVQYAWPHASRRYLYVVSSNGGPGGSAGDQHHATAFRMAPASGALAKHGDSVELPSRPIHVTTDIPSEHLLTAYNQPSGLTVHQIRGDGTIGEAGLLPAPLDTGVFAHQVRVMPSNRAAILVARGNDRTAAKPEDPGALKVFSYREGVIGRSASVAPNGGVGFGPRHLDFHPTRPWVYVSLERENKLDMFRIEGDGLGPQPAFRKDLLAQPGNVRPRQLGGTVHVHPNGRFVYGINRADATTEFRGQRVFAGGENSVAVYSIDEVTGEHRLVQHVDTRGFHPRTFHIDPSGRLMVVAHILPMPVREGDAVTRVPACLSVFRIGADGRLTFVRKLDVDTGKSSMFWMGMVGL